MMLSSLMSALGFHTGVLSTNGGLDIASLTLASVCIDC